jgi:hypothetical protein
MSDQCDFKESCHTLFKCTETERTDRDFTTSDATVALFCISEGASRMFATWLIADFFKAEVLLHPTVTSKPTSHSDSDTGTGFPQYVLPLSVELNQSSTPNHCYTADAMQLY